MKKADGLNQRCKIIPLSVKREEKDHEQLLLELREFIEGKVEAGEPVVVIIEKSVSCWDKLKSRLGF